MPTDKIIAFLGGGNMATALAGGLINRGVAPERIRVAEPQIAKRQALTDELGVRVFAGNGEAVQGAQVVVVAVKPDVVVRALESVRAELSPAALILSIAAGVTIATLASALPPGQKVVRAMPNTPALIGDGISALFPGPGVSPGELELAGQLLGAVGEVVTLGQEGLLDAVTALSGSGPAFVYLMAEALSDGGVACGLPREVSDRLALHTLVGSARLVLASGKHPGVLKNQVTSPGGTTIAGLAVLERAGTRGILMAAVEAAWRRARELGGGGK